MERGLPRPLNRKGLPVPYVALGPDDLGAADATRLGEVYRDNLCQVCGLLIERPALIVLRTDNPEWWPDGQVLDGLIHPQECGPLAFRSCPYLLRRQGFEVLRVGPDDVDAVHGHLTVVKEHESLRVPFEAI